MIIYSDEEIDVAEKKLEHQRQTQIEFRKPKYFKDCKQHAYERIPETVVENIKYGGDFACIHCGFVRKGKFGIFQFLEV